MTFCRAFGITPLEWGDQPADVVMRWSRHLEIESEMDERRDTLERMRQARSH